MIHLLSDQPASSPEQQTKIEQIHAYIDRIIQEDDLDPQKAAHRQGAVSALISSRENGMDDIYLKLPGEMISHTIAVLKYCRGIGLTADELATVVLSTFQSAVPHLSGSPAAQ